MHGGLVPKGSGDTLLAGTPLRESPLPLPSRFGKVGKRLGGDASPHLSICGPDKRGPPPCPPFGVQSFKRMTIFVSGRTWRMTYSIASSGMAMQPPVYVRPSRWQCRKIADPFPGIRSSFQVVFRT